MSRFRTVSLNGTWRYEPQAHLVLTPDGHKERRETLPPGGDVALPCNRQLGGLDDLALNLEFYLSIPQGGLSSPCVAKRGETGWIAFTREAKYSRNSS